MTGRTMQRDIRGAAIKGQSLPRQVESRNGYRPDGDDHDKIKTMHNFSKQLRGELEKHVIGQPKMIVGVVAAIMAGIKIALVGSPGVGKTWAAEKAVDILNFTGRLVPLTPDITAPEIIGSMVLDPETHKKVYWPSPFIGNEGNPTQLIILDELNRASEKAMTAMLQPLSKNTVIVDEMTYPMVEEFITIMTMNPPQDGGTRPLFSALADRIDFTLTVEAPKEKEDIIKILDYDCDPTAMARNTLFTAEIIRDLRKCFNVVRRSTTRDVKETAAEIYSGFSDKSEWRICATPRTAISMVRMATIVAIIENGIVAGPQHVWKVAPGCLGMLEPATPCTSKEKLQKIGRRLIEIGCPSSLVRPSSA